MAPLSKTWQLYVAIKTPRNVASCLGRWFVLPQQLLPLLPLHKTLFCAGGHLTSSGQRIKLTRLSHTTIEPPFNAVVVSNHKLQPLKKCLKLLVAQTAAVNVHMRTHSVPCPFIMLPSFLTSFLNPRLRINCAFLVPRIDRSVKLPSRRIDGWIKPW